MKALIQSVLAVSLLSATAVFAQNVGLNSPNNYKRPVFQQNQNPQGGVVVQRGQFQNNLNSVHNYKRQGSTNTALESSLVLNVPVLPPPTLNPLLLPGHYKVHFRPLGVVQELAQRKPQVQGQKSNTTK